MNTKLIIPGAQHITMSIQSTTTNDTSIFIEK